MGKYKNNIKNILIVKGISINKMAEDLEMHYRTLYTLVNREFIDTSKFSNIADIATYLDVSIDLLYVNVDDIKKESGVNQMKLDKIVDAGLELKKIISKENDYSETEYIEKMKGTIHTLNQSANRRDYSKYFETVMAIYTQYKLPLPYEVQEMLTSYNEEEWGKYATGFVMGLMTGEED